MDPINDPPVQSRSVSEPIMRPQTSHRMTADLILAHEQILRLTEENHRLITENRRLLHEQSEVINGYFVEAAENQVVELMLPQIPSLSNTYNQLLSSHAQLTMDHSKLRLKVSDLDASLQASKLEVARLLRILGGGSSGSSVCSVNTTSSPPTMSPTQSARWRQHRRSAQRTESPATGRAAIPTTPTSK